jgi:hypothetical protein
MGVELVRALPGAISSAANFMGKMADARQAEYQMMMAARGSQPALPPARNVTPGPQAVPSPPAQPQAQPQAQAPANGQPSAEQRDANGKLVPADYWEMIEAKIVTILDDRDTPITQLADDTLTWLDIENKQVTDNLLAAGEDGLLQLFTTRRILMQVPQDPRLTEFIKKFVELGTESRRAAATPATDAAPQPGA